MHAARFDIQHLFNQHLFFFITFPRFHTNEYFLKSKYKTLVYCRYRKRSLTFWPLVFVFPLWRRVYAPNVRLRFLYRQYTNVLYFDLNLNTAQIHSTLRLLINFSFRHSLHNILFTTLSSQHSLHNILFKTFSSQHSLHNILFTTFSSQLSLHNILFTTFSSKHSLQNILFTTFSSKHSLHNILSTTFSSQHSLQNILFTTFSSKHSLHNILFKKFSS